MNQEINPMTGDPPPALNRQFYSLGFLCQQLQAMPPKVEAIAEAAGVSPAMWVDGIPHYNGDAVVAMQQHVGKVAKAVKTAVETN